MTTPQERRAQALNPAGHRNCHWADYRTQRISGIARYRCIDDALHAISMDIAMGYVIFGHRTLTAQLWHAFRDADVDLLAASRDASKWLALTDVEARNKDMRLTSPERISALTAAIIRIGIGEPKQMTQGWPHHYPEVVMRHHAALAVQYQRRYVSAVCRRDRMTR